MITNFEQITESLNDYERNVLVPTLILGLKSKIGKENVISNRIICKKMQEAGYKVSSVKIRKMINYIRVTGLLPMLCSNSKGYFVGNVDDTEKTIVSIEERAKSMFAVARALKNQLEKHNNPSIFENEKTSEREYNH
jgi:predicted GTPase|tara:strand:+ start:950 stop:1360 length:411 start_codon:yes stop_codon:yes gene_type:complete